MGHVLNYCFFLVVSGFDYCDEAKNCKNKIAGLLESSPNEFGDALAGFAGTLAFLWIVITVLIQSRQLAAQKKELQLTRFEFREMATAQKEQVRIMGVQKVIFEKEQKQREEVEAKEVLDSLKQRLQKEIGNLRDSPLRWKWVGQNGNTYVEIECWSDDREELIDKFCESVSAVWWRLIHKGVAQSCEFLRGPCLPTEAKWIAATLEQIEHVLPKLSEAERIRAENLGLDMAFEDWSGLISCEEIWDDEEK